MNRLLSLACALVLLCSKTHAQFEPPVQVGYSSGFPALHSLGNLTGSDTLELITLNQVFTITPGLVSTGVPLPEWAPCYSGGHRLVRINNDEYLDYFCMTAEENNLVITWYKGSEDPAELLQIQPDINVPLSENVYASVGTNPLTPVVKKDLDLDGDDELLIVSDEEDEDGSRHMLILANDGEAFHQVANLSIPVYCLNCFLHLFFIDLNMDGYLDILIPDELHIACIQQTEGLNFEVVDSDLITAEQLYELESVNTYAEFEPSFIDFNADGLIDIFFHVPYLESAVLYNTGNFQFELDISVIEECDYVDYNGNSCGGIDLDNDGDLDRMNTDYFYRKESDGTETAFYLGDDGGHLFSDYDLDGDIDVFFGINQTLQIMLRENTGVPMIENPGYFHAAAFTDYNGNQQQDFNEVTIPIPVLVDNNYIFQADGAQLALEAGTHQFAAVYDQELWTCADSSLQIVMGESSFLLFALQPLAPVINLEAHIWIPFNVACGDTTTAIIAPFNNGNTLIPSALIELELDPMYGFISSSAEPDSIVGNHYYWTRQNIYYQENCGFTVKLTLPAVQHMGEVAHCILTTHLNGGIVSTVDHYHDVNCSFDPNEIEVIPAGFTSEGYILPGTPLTYIVHFQNTGTATAHDVSITDQLPANLMKETLQVLATSHPLQSVNINEAGEARFFFNNILLPDSSVSEEGSKGYVMFTIAPENDVVPGDIIANNATIYFDMNEGVVTNTVLNTIFDCAWMNTGFTMDDAVCVGANVSGTTDNDFFAETSWSINGEPATSEEVFTHVFDQAGDYTVGLNASNILCDQYFEQTVQVVSYPATPVITQDGNILITNAEGNIEWYLNDELISNANSAELEITQSGEYAVSATNTDGCTSLSDGITFVYTGNTELNNTTIGLYPNPADHELNLSVPAAYVNGTVSIHAADSRLVSSLKVQQAKMRVDISSLSPGAYTIIVRANGCEELHLPFVAR